MESKEMAAAYSENNKKNKLRAKCTVSDVTEMLHIVTRYLERLIYVSGFHIQTISQTWKGKTALTISHFHLNQQAKRSLKLPALSTIYWETGRRKKRRPPAFYWDTSSSPCEQKLKTIPILIHQHPATSSHSTVIKFRFNSISFKSSLWKMESWL